MDDALKEEVLELFMNLIDEVDINKSTSIIDQTKKYSDSLIKRGLSHEDQTRLQLVDDLIVKFDKTGDTKNKKIILAALEYFIDPWDVIPDVDLNEGLKDDFFVLEKAKEKLASKPETTKKSSEEARSLKLSPSSIFDDLGYNPIKHILKLSNDMNLYSPKQRGFIIKMANINRANKPVNNKERVYFTMLVEKFFKDLWNDVKCPNHPCSECYHLKKVYRDLYNLG